MEINKVYNYDCIEGLRLMEDESVDCCVTSPPYWGLRDYGTAEWVGGNPDCPHKRETKKSDKTITGYKNFDDMMGVGDSMYKSVCPLCGAVRVDRQIGLEETPEQYVEKLVMIFREVKRVMKKEGTLWLNLGDSYNANYRGGGVENYSDFQKANKGTLDFMATKKKELKNIKPKDLVGIPWMVAFALRADGWYLRQDIIWHKPNCMPESVKDRCTKAHEYIFLLTKSGRYYYDADAIREPHSSTPWGKGENGSIGKPNVGWLGQNASDKSGWWLSGRAGNHPRGRNKRTVWSIPTRPFKGAHFAVFPPDLIEPCILAGCPEGGIVLDPFMGSGTTGMVAAMYQRNFIGFELNPEYCKMAERRLEQNRVGWGQLGISDIFSEEQ